MTHRFHVLVTDYLTEAGVEQQVLGELADIELLLATHEDAVAKRAAAADAVLLFHDVKLTEASIAAMTKARAIVRSGVGFDNVDLESAGRCGIVVCNVPDYGTEEVADHAVMMLLAVARRLVPAHNAIVAGGWDAAQVFGAPRLRGKTLGLIGCGRIGSATALRAKAFGLRVVFYDPYVPRGLDKALGVERCDRLEELLPQCRFVSLHCPLTRETRHILGAHTLGLLPPGADVINTARGPCIDNTALLAALESGHVGHAALDVVEHEPLDNERLRKHPRVLLTPHVAYYSAEGYVEMRTKAAQEIRRALTGEPVHNPVNLHCLSAPRCRVTPHPSPNR